MSSPAPGTQSHIGYSTLVHPGDDWEAMNASLRRYVPAVKEAISPDGPFGVSLRLSAESVRHLLAHPEERTELRAFLHDNDLYVFTVNAFPYGPFSGGPVMENVYEPDWSTPERRRYTMDVATILAEISSSGRVSPSIQTAPLAFREKVTGLDYLGRMTTNVLATVAHLMAIEREQGVRIKLALEPEPACYLESTEETIRYFSEHLYGGGGPRQLGDLASVPLSEAHGALRRHLGIVFDMGHQAVGFEDLPAALVGLEEAGIPIFKFQAAAALRVPEATDDVIEELRRFTDTIYLSQTTVRSSESSRKYLELVDAIDEYTNHRHGEEWRTHFHVPIFLDGLGSIGTTRRDIEAAMAIHRQVPQSDHLEVETYTWDVLPDHYKTGDIVEYVSRELLWLQAQLDGEETRE